MEMIFLLQESHTKNGRIEKIIKNFPSNDIDQIPLSIKKEFKKFIIENADIDKFWFHLPNKERVNFENIDSKTRDAFSVKILDDEIFTKFQKKSCPQMLEMQLFLKKKLSSEENLTKLTLGEVDSFKKRLAQIKFGQICIDFDQRAEN
jgi:hypothetical protein